MEKTKKICAVLILTVTIFIFPQRTNAQYIDIVQQIKEFGLDTLAYSITNRVLGNITASTVNWINSGFNGNPAYITNPGRFFSQVAEGELNSFLSTGNMANLCSPFRESIQLTISRNFYREPAESYSCTLDTIVNNYDNFMNDFDQGGWDSWFEITQKPENNPYGAYLQSVEVVARNIGGEQKRYEDQLDWGRGFLSYERCNEVDGGINCETLTPGSVIQGQLDAALGSGKNRLEVADELNEMIGELMNEISRRAVSSLGLGSGDLTPEGIQDGDFSPQEVGEVTPSDGATMTCDENLQNCDIDLNNPASGETQTPEEILDQRIAELEARLARERETLRQMLILGPDVGEDAGEFSDRVRDQQELIEDIERTLGNLRARRG